MFWNTGGKNQQALPYNKFNFIVNFSGLNEKLIELETDDKVLSFFAKKVSAPNMKVEFERAYANEYVHYFQNGAIHWEPITITFADFGITSGENSTGNDVNNNQEVSVLESQLDISSKLSIREIFNYYLQTNLLPPLEEIESTNIQKSEVMKNVTGIIDLPIFCNFIQVKNNIRFANKDFSTKNNKSVLNREIVYEFYNPRVTSVDFGSFEYGSDDINEISVTFVPQWAVIK